MWAVLIGTADWARSRDLLVERYDVDAARLDADLERFAQRCAADGLLLPAQPGAGEPAAAASGSARPPRFAAPTTLGALRSLAATQWALRRAGFRAVYERCAALPAGGEDARLERAVAAFSRAENLFVARRAPDDCLVRSLALYRFLRSAGIPAQHLIGVQRFPFLAHAWVECDGVPVLDERRRRQQFTPLACLGA
jgi:transglutaminase superfamily protein